MKILLVEDDDDKAERVLEFLYASFAEVSVLLKKSLHEGLLTLIAEKNSLDLVLLDMSMPNFDIADAEPTGGKPENLAGRDLLTQMKLRKIVIPTIVLTMYDSFEKETERKSIGELKTQLQNDFQPVYKGLIQYSTTQEGWQSSLLKLIGEIRENFNSR